MPLSLLTSGDLQTQQRSAPRRGKVRPVSFLRQPLLPRLGDGLAGATPVMPDWILLDDFVALVRLVAALAPHSDPVDLSFGRYSLLSLGRT